MSLTVIQANLRQILFCCLWGFRVLFSYHHLHPQPPMRPPRAAFLLPSPPPCSAPPAQPPDPTLPDNDSQTGGRGIFLMKALMDEVQFNERGNSVTLVLRFEGEATA